MSFPSHGMIFNLLFHPRPYASIFASKFLELDLETPQSKILPEHTADNFDWQIMNVESRVSAISIIIMQTHLSTTHQIKADLI